MAQGPQNRKMQSIIGISQSNHFKEQQLKESSIIRDLTKQNLLPSGDKPNGAQQDVINQYNERINRKYAQLQEEKKENALMNYSNLDEKALNNLILEPSKISPLLKVLEEENQVLKGEVASVSMDLARFMEWVELLLEENRFMRGHINKKNCDI